MTLELQWLENGLYMTLGVINYNRKMFIPKIGHKIFATSEVLFLRNVYFYLHKTCDLGI